jgi:hypothetical protein
MPIARVDFERDIRSREHVMLVEFRIPYGYSDDVDVGLMSGLCAILTHASYSNEEKMYALGRLLGTQEPTPQVAQDVQPVARGPEPEAPRGRHIRLDD